MFIDVLGSSICCLVGGSLSRSCVLLVSLSCVIRDMYHVLVCSCVMLFITFLSFLFPFLVLFAISIKFLSILVIHVLYHVLGFPVSFSCVICDAYHVLVSLFPFLVLFTIFITFLFPFLLLFQPVILIISANYHNYSFTTSWHKISSSLQMLSYLLTINKKAIYNLPENILLSMNSILLILQVIYQCR